MVLGITILVFWVYYNWNPFSGIDDNDTMKVFGKGGADVERNKPGDLYVTIKVPFQFFSLYMPILALTLVSTMQDLKKVKDEINFHFPITGQRGPYLSTRRQPCAC